MLGDLAIFGAGARILLGAVRRGQPVLPGLLFAPDWMVRGESFAQDTRCPGLMVDVQLGVADRDQGFGFAAAAGQPPVAGALAGLGLPGGDGGLAEQAAEVPVAFLLPRSK